MKRIRPFLVGAACLAIPVLWPAAFLWLADEVFAAPMDYVVEAEFRKLPATDDALEQWLHKQPGVYLALVSRDGNKLHLVWGNAGTRFSDPVSPNVCDEFAKLGYQELVSYKEGKNYRDK